MGKQFGVAERLRAVDLGGRVPPHNRDAEAAVLSAVLTDNATLDVVLPLLLEWLGSIG